MKSKMTKKRQKEQKIINLMIDLYTRVHDDIDGDELKKYSANRISKCPRIVEKTFCSTCKIHCYNKEYREQIKRVMRYSGPRMLLHHPILAINHALNTLKNQ